MATPTHHTPVHNNVRILQKRRLRQDIKNMLLRFKLKELTNLAIISMFELEPIEVNNKMNELRLPMNKQSLAQLLSHRAQAFSVEELEESLYLLKLYKAAFGNGRQWSTLKLQEPAAGMQWHADVPVIRRNLLQAFRIKALNAVVKVISHKELIWIMIINKKLTRRKGVKIGQPTFICYEVGFPYIFVMPNIIDLYLECLLKAMQFQKAKVHKLVGKDATSLLNLLKHKTENTKNARSVTYNPAQAEEGPRVVNFSKHKARQAYADKVFKTVEPVQLQTFVVHADAEWRGEASVPGMAGERFPSVMTLKSKNLVAMIKDMVAKGMFVTPLPEYVQTILSSAKNKITISHPQNAK